MAELYDIFTGEEIALSTRNTEFAEHLTPELVVATSELGLRDEFVGIFARHVSDLHIGVTRTGWKRASGLDVIYHDDEYKRLAVVNYEELALKSKLLENVLENQNINSNTQTTEKLALTWIFYELSADALANSVYMQQKYDHYIPDFNGQSYAWLSQYTIADQFYEEYGDGSETARDIETEHSRFKAGFSLFMMKDALLSRNITDRDKHAQWIVEELRSNYPYEKNGGKQTLPPLRSRELMQRLEALEVKKPLVDLASFVLAVYGPENEIEQ